MQNSTNMRILELLRFLSMNSIRSRAEEIIRAEMIYV